MMPHCCDHETDVISLEEGSRSNLVNVPCHGDAINSDEELQFPRSQRNNVLIRNADDELYFSRERKEQRQMSASINRRKHRRIMNWPCNLALVTVFLTVFCQTEAFTIPIRPSQFIVRSSICATATPPEETITAVQPQKRSKKQRRKSSRQISGLTITTDPNIPDNFESYFDFIDSAFPGTASGESLRRISSRPKGRPASVPGAMSRQTLMDIRELRDGVSVRSSETTFVNQKPIVERASDSLRTDLNSIGDTPPIAQKKRGRGRPRKNALPNDEISPAVPLTKDRKTVTAASVTTPTVAERVNSTAVLNEVENRRKTRKVKNLPPSRAKKDLGVDSETTGMMDKGDDSPNLQKYYRTELLSAHEEYELGMKVQFMMKSEEVHEGLHLKLVRLPTITEWAAACGFIIDDDVHISAEDVDHILPLNVGSGEPQDPNMFVGNGLANNSGPGRGKGRVKGPPPTFLEDFFYDTESEFEDVNGKRVKKKVTPNLKPINRGTPQDFVNMMLEGKEAKQRMVQCNMRLVVSISKRYGHVGVNIADLIQEGSIGLSRAAEKFEPMMGFKFSTYASWWIQQAVFRAIAYHSRTIRLPVHVHNHLNRVRRVRQEVQREKGRPPTNEEMAEEMNMTVEKYNKMLRLSRRAISLDIAKYQNNPKDVGQESDTSLGDTIDAADVIKDENTPEQNVNRVLFRDDLKEMLKILGDDERAVINARYGLNDGLTQTVTTVAAKMGQTKSWVRSAECCALRKLRRPWYEKRLWEHQNSLSG